MTASAKIVSLGVLTFFIMGLSTYVQQGSFIVPYPFITEFSFFTIVAILFKTVKENSITFVMLLVFALFGVLSGRFLWETFLTFDALVWFFESTYWVHIFKLLHYIALAVLIALQVKQDARWQLKVTHTISLLLLAVCLLVNDENYMRAWYIFYGIVCLLSLFTVKSISNQNRIVLEFFTGLGVIHLLSIFSIGLNS